MLDPTELTATHLADLVTRRAISLQAVGEAFISRLESVNPAINAMVYWDKTSIRRQLALMQQRLDRGEALPLAGVPVAVKDNLWVKGWPITQGSRLFEGFIAPDDALVVKRLRVAGALILGISNCPEFACRGFTTNHLYGVTRNPWDLERTPGGSSGGSASAVAARLCPLALGTDAGGSIRRPAAHTGIVGFMPSSGTVPAGPGFEEPVFGNSSIGVFARQVDDVRLAMTVIGDRHPHDSHLTGHSHSDKPHPGPAGKAGSRPLRIGFSDTLGLALQVERDLARCVSAAVMRLGDAGLKVSEICPQWPEGTSEAKISALETSALAAMFGPDYRRDKTSFDTDVAAQIGEGLELQGIDVANALRFRKVLAAHFNRCFDTMDVLLCPTTPVTAWTVDQPWPTHINGQPVGGRDHAVFTWLINQVFATACSVPCGLDDQGLPVGIQVIAPRFCDHQVLAVASRIEASTTASFRAPIG